MIRRLRELALRSALSALAGSFLLWGCTNDTAPHAPTGYGGGPSTPNPTLMGGSSVDVDIRLADGPGGGAYLIDRSENTLYVFANDIPGGGASACEGGCVDQWPPFDEVDPTVSSDLSRADFDRFRRPDGSWQSTFGGRPLYHFASDSSSNPRAGDGVGNRWFAARAYFALVTAKTDIAPLGTDSRENDPYLTNRAGRTAYIFANDDPGPVPTSACTEGCLDAWPIWPAPSDLGNLIVPMGLDAADFGGFERVVAGETVRQLTYREWPLYYFAEDDQPGETAGHDRPNWSAVNPLAFAQSRAAASAE